MKEERLTIRISTQEKEMLKAKAEEMDVSVGHIVREAIKKYFQEVE